MKSGLVFKCHNCGVGRSFGNFLKDNANDIYDEYVIERYKSGLTGKGRNVADPEFNFEAPKFVKKETNIPNIIVNQIINNWLKDRNNYLNEIIK